MAELERRYIVFKIKDVEQLPQRVKDALYIVEHGVQQLRYERGADPKMPCLVVEKDWPEYRPTLEAILARADSAQVDAVTVKAGEPADVQAWIDSRRCEEWPEHWDGRDRAAFERALDATRPYGVKTGGEGQQ